MLLLMHTKICSGLANTPIILILLTNPITIAWNFLLAKTLKQCTQRLTFVHIWVT